MDNVNSAHATPEMARIILTVQNAIAADEKVISAWNRTRDKEKKIWNTLSEDKKQEKRRQGLHFSDAKISRVQLRESTRAFRRKLRYKIFRIRDLTAAKTLSEDKELHSLAAWYEKQFRSGWGFVNFTFEWDISAVDPLKVISPFEWDGDVTDQTLRIEQGSRIQGKFCDPTAFTNQEM